MNGCFSMDARLNKKSLFIGIDVSGSFYNNASFESAIKFTAYYIYAHLNGLGDLREPRALFVGSIGGDSVDEPKSFHPIHDFQEKSVEQIEEDLRTWFPESNKLTDFNIFFQKIANLVKKQNLTLSPIEIVMISDGIPDIAEEGVKEIEDRIKRIDIASMQYLARSITVRLLYPNPTIAGHWDKLINWKRVRIWTQDTEVMNGWQNQLEKDVPVEKQLKLFQWIKDNVDFPVRVRRF
ncbi:MAG: hypothetical protein ABII27_03175 [bacterium]